MLRQRTEGLVIRDLGQEIIILDVECNLVHQLNGTASFIWRNCDEARCEAQIVVRLLEAFDVGEDAAIQDVSQTIAQLRDLKLVKSVPA